jgi:hypothetical protein
MEKALTLDDVSDTVITEYTTRELHLMATTLPLTVWYHSIDSDASPLPSIVVLIYASAGGGGGWWWWVVVVMLPVLVASRQNSEFSVSRLSRGSHLTMKERTAYIVYCMPTQPIIPIIHTVSVSSSSLRYVLLSLQPRVRLAK